MPYSRAYLSDTILGHVCMPMAACMGWSDSSQWSWAAQESSAVMIWKRQPHHVHDIKKIHSNPVRLHFKESFQFAVVGMT